MDFLTWIIVGLVAGLLASYAIGGIGYGLLGDIVVGVVGAVLGSWLFGQFDLHAPFSGLPGVTFVAFVGAVVLLLVLKALRSTRTA